MTREKTPFYCATCGAEIYTDADLEKPGIVSVECVTCTRTYPFDEDEWHKSLGYDTDGQRVILCL